MKKLIALAVLVTAIGLVLATSAEAFFLNGGTRDQLKNQRPPDSYQGQWYTTPDGCSYSRAKAPGYRTTWHLIINPHHIGQPNAKKSCPVML